jgi:hypothetical protein
MHALGSVLEDSLHFHNAGKQYQTDECFHHMKLSNQSSFSFFFDLDHVWRLAAGSHNMLRKGRNIREALPLSPEVIISQI